MLQILKKLFFDRETAAGPVQASGEDTPPAQDGAMRHDAAALGRFETGMRFYNAGHYGQAEPEFRAAVDIAHDFVEAHFFLGVVLFKLEHYEDAADSFLLAECFRPGFPEAHYYLGLIASKQKRYEDAIRSFEKAIAAGLQLVDVHSQLGRAYRRVGKFDESLTQLRTAVAMAPQDAVSHTNLAYLLYVEFNQSEEALFHARRAIELDPDLPEAHCNYGMILEYLGRTEEALNECAIVLRRYPDHQKAHMNRALSLLKMGNFAEGWPEHEFRMGIYDCFKFRKFPQPDWDGSPLAGRTILVYAEQGLGDEIMFASCLPDLIRSAGHCIVDCNEKLEKIFRRSFPAVDVHCGAQIDRDLSWLDRFPKADCKVACASLPLHFRRTAADFPAHDGYLRADAPRVEFWKQKVAELGGKLRVGLSWRGGTKYTNLKYRSIDLAQLAPVLRVPDVSFVNLQYTDCREELDRVRTDLGFRLHRWQEAIDDYDETAALVSALDLVISVQTSVVHLAGALGESAWVMVPAAPEWRYQMQGDRMPWYPSVRIFRQERLGEWGPLIDTVAASLRDLAASR